VAEAGSERAACGKIGPKSFRGSEDNKKYENAEVEAEVRCQKSQKMLMKQTTLTYTSNF